MFNGCYEFPKIDMETFYREALKCNKFAGIPQIMIAKELPGNKNVLRYSLPEGRSIIYLKYGKNTLKTLKAEFKKPAAELMEAPEAMLHSLGEEQIGYLITYGILTCNMLKISCPQFAFYNNLELAGTANAETNMVALKTAASANAVSLLRTMFYQVRILWQAKHHPEYAETEKAALDAEAFAGKLFGAITGQEAYAEVDEALKAQLIEQAETIELDDNTVTLFKDMLNA